MAKQKRILVNIPDDLWEILQQLSEKYGVSIGGLCGNFLAEAKPYFGMILESLKKADEDKTQAFLMMAETLNSVNKHNRELHSECLAEVNIRKKSGRKVKATDKKADNKEE